MTANRWHRAVKTATFTVSDFAYDSRRQGAPSITNTVFSYPGMAPFLEETLRGVVDLKAIQAWVEKNVGNDKAEIPVVEGVFVKKMLATVVSKLQAMGLDAGDIFAKILLNFPELIAQLLADGAVLHDGETREDFLDFLDSLSFSEIKDLVVQWYKFNLEDIVGPLVSKARAAQAQSKDQPKPAPKRRSRRA